MIGQTINSVADVEPLVRKWEATQGKEKIFDLGGNRTHNFQI